ncbi:MAG: hypothetical protein ACRD2N_10395 [Vicinamibacterales bacterium]
MRAGLALMASLVVSSAGAQIAPDPVLYRVFLTDGRTLASYGEWARLDDRVVFSMPTRITRDPADLHLVSIPANRVDWPKTDAYTNSVRAAGYAASRGEADFAKFSDDVARVLNEVAVMPDAKARLATAERARQSLADWPRTHYGYRDREVGEILGMLDGLIAELRVAAGQTRFDLALTAPMPADPAAPLLPPPTNTDVVDELVTASTLVQTSAERVSLLQTVVALLESAVGLLPQSWAERIRKSARKGLKEEEKLDKAYADLSKRAIRSAVKAGANGDTRKLEEIREHVRKEDAKLGGRRASDVTALLATLEVEVDVARRWQLALDQYEMRAPGFRLYRRSMIGSLSTFRAATKGLEEVRAMVGPKPKAITPIARRLARGNRTLYRVKPPSELAPAHALVRSAWELAESAFRLRIDAALHNNIEGARQASSAAAGALMLYAKARAELDEVMQKPARP